jgi:hypothetical protein
MRDLLEAHGTKLFTLKPSSIIAAAEADLKLRRARKGGQPSSAPYCFHRAHVAAASGAFDLIDRAIRDRYSGVYCGKRITRTIYSDEALLSAVCEQLALPAGV